MVTKTTVATDVTGTAADPDPSPGDAAGGAAAEQNPPEPAAAASSTDGSPDAASASAGGKKKETGNPEPTGQQAKDWREDRLRVETAKRREAEGKARQLEEQIATLRQQSTVQQPTVQQSVQQPQIDEAAIERRVNDRAAQQAQWDSFNRACEGAAAQGRDQYGQTEFATRVNELRKLADPNDPVSMATYNGFLAAALETGEAPKLIYALGSDLNEANRILSLPPLKMAVELTKMAAKPEQQLSKAAKPITPLNGRGITHEAVDPTDKDRADALSTKAWMERRNAQIAAREKAEQGRA